MAEYDNMNSGALFKNDRKAADTHADWNGSINVGGHEYWLNAWVKEKKGDGSKFFSLSVKPKDGARATPAPTRAPAPRAQPLDDEVPF